MLLSPSTPDQSFLTHFDMIKFDTMNLKEYLDKLPAPLNHPATLASLLVVAIFGRWFFTYLKVRMVSKRGAESISRPYSCSVSEQC